MSEEGEIYIEVAPGEYERCAVPAIPTQPCREVCGSNEVWTPESGCKCHPPAVPATCEYCGPVCYRGAKHNARVEDGARYTDDPVPAVPAQEAPRGCDCPDSECLCPMAEPQAGAQVPSLDIIRQLAGGDLEPLLIQRINAAEAHLNTIRNYAEEAAKTPITREDMHDPLKAQTFFDEAKGFERLVLSEIGGA